MDKVSSDMIGKLSLILRVGGPNISRLPGSNMTRFPGKVGKENQGENKRVSISWRIALTPSHSGRRGESISPYPVAMLSRRATVGVCPSKFDMIVLQTDNYIVTVGQCTNGKSVTAEKVVFRAQTV